MSDKLSKVEMINLLPHREPMLLIDELINIKKLFSATAIVNVKKDSFFVQGHFPGNPVMPGVLIVEAFGQAAAALTAHGIDKETYENKLVFLMGIEKARFRNPVIPDCKLELNIEDIRSHGRVWKYKGEAIVDGKKMLDLEYTEDSNADVDLNVVKTGSGGYVEIQGTAEQEPFDDKQMDAMLKLADKGIKELIALQKRSSASKYFALIVCSTIMIASSINKKD